MKQFDGKGSNDVADMIMSISMVSNVKSFLLRVDKDVQLLNGQNTTSPPGSIALIILTNHKMWPTSLFELNASCKSLTSIDRAVAQAASGRKQ